MAKVLRSATAKRDLVMIFADLGERAGLPVADRFLQSARESFTQLAQFPDIGSPGKISRAKYSDVRLWSVKDFPNYLIAYRPIADGVVIERVFHAAQDYQRILS